jgi:hypothetical protein
MYGSGHNRITQKADKLSDDAVIWYTYAYLLPVFVYPRKLLPGRKDKGEGARQIFTHQAENDVANLGVFADIRQIVADD